mmetsp:Transcript_30892/g.71806  ORF Transcript_30892/g.71806 Transcript_30892/m.71806 type:complete len:259 (+) Transcript_30892:164-940(+)
MPMAPMGAVMRMTSTESINTSSARATAVGPNESSTTMSSAVPPTAACTVALGIHAMHTSSASFVLSVEPNIASRVTEIRTAREMAMIKMPAPRSSGLMAWSFTDAPSKAKSAGCAMPQHQFTFFWTALRLAVGHRRAAVQPITTAASAPPPEKLSPLILTYLPPKMARKAAPNAPSVCAFVPSFTAGGEATKKPAMMPRKMPATSSTGALSTSHVKFCGVSDSPDSAKAKVTPKPAMASTSSKDAAAMTIDGMPFSVP